jgi:phosphatidylglycerol:prolipoprotein diacylglycerol transferase
VFKNERYYVKDYETKSLRRVSMWIIIDSIVPSIFIGQIIGRFGNYFNQELYGPVVTDANTIKWLEIFFPRMCISGVWQEPTFFYEQVGNIIGLCVIYFGMELVTNKKIRTCGNLGIMYFIWYGVVRLIMTPLRMSGGGSGGEHVNLITTILWIVFGITFLFLNMFVFSKYLRNKRIVWFSWISICYLLSGGFRHEISRNKYNFDKSKFIRSPQEMFWYNNF